MAVDTQTKESPQNFDGKTALPESDHQRESWQDANRKWWESNPMQYDWKSPIGSADFTKQFFQEIDNRFLSQASEYLSPSERPFGTLIPYDELKNFDVLEIGVGAGTHASLLATSAQSFTGIDLTERAITCTRQRFELFQIEGKIIHMDAEKMDFADQSFDFIWSWGVIHHSADTGKILQEIHRVLRPGGRAVIMVYNRNFWNYYIVHGLFHGILKGDFFRGKNIAKIMQEQTDGAIARFYTKPEWTNLVNPFFSVDKIDIYGQKSDLVPLPQSKLKNMIIRLIPDNLARFFTHTQNMGYFLVAHMRRN